MGRGTCALVDCVRVRGRCMARTAEIACLVGVVHSKNMSCNTTCYTRDTCTSRWNLVAIFGAVGR
eukprot:5554660-Pleurochrysis_carterae.AAC.1